MSDPISGEATSATQAPSQGVEPAIPSTSGKPPRVDAPASGGRSRIALPGSRARRRMLATAGLALAVAVVVLIATDPFAGGGKAGAGVLDNASATSLATVKRQSLSQQTQVSGTLGYAGSSSIRVASGTRALRRPAGQPAGRERRSDADHGLRDAGCRHAGARGPPGDAGCGAREGGGGLRGGRRRGSRLRQRLARKRKQLAGCGRELVLERRAGRVLGPAERHRRRRQAHRRPLTGLLCGKTARECAVQFVHGAFVGRALWPGFDLHGAAVGRPDRRARAEPVRDRRPAGAADVWRDAGDAGVRRRACPRGATWPS